MFKTAQNLIFFKAGWIACILFAAAGMPLLSLLSVAVVAGIHLARVAVPAKEALFLLCAAGLGLVWESVLAGTGLLQYVGADGGAWLAPAWIVSMWVLFGTTINYGLSWLKRHWIYPVVFGLFGGPAAFYAGSKMGAVAFGDTLLAMGVLAAGWAILLPLACLISDTITDSEWFEGSGNARGKRAAQKRTSLEPVHITHHQALLHG
jgi:hypothetical protein